MNTILRCMVAGHFGVQKSSVCTRGTSINGCMQKWRHAHSDPAHKLNKNTTSVCFFPGGQGHGRKIGLRLHSGLAEHPPSPSTGPLHAPLPPLPPLLSRPPANSDPLSHHSAPSPRLPHPPNTPHPTPHPLDCIVCVRPVGYYTFVRSLPYFLYLFQGSRKFETTGKCGVDS